MSLISCSTKKLKESICCLTKPLTFKKAGRRFHLSYRRVRRAARDIRRSLPLLCRWDQLNCEILEFILPPCARHKLAFSLRKMVLITLRKTAQSQMDMIIGGAASFTSSFLKASASSLTGTFVLVPLRFAGPTVAGAAAGASACGGGLPVCERN